MADIKYLKVFQVNGRNVVEPSDFVYLNTRYHKPYLAVRKNGEFDWQAKVWSGYGKNSSCYYVVEDLKEGDLIQAAGGSGGNKYPFKGRVLSVNDEELKVEEIDEIEFSNLII